ncbi:unnamed protein product, partial [marine sediment metagenome]
MVLLVVCDAHADNWEGVDMPTFMDVHNMDGG